MIVSLIVALTNNYVIGRAQSIPWFLSNDMIWFKKHTLNKPVIMGYKTFKSIGGQPLSNRFNIVLTRKKIIHNMSSVIFVNTLEEVMCVVTSMRNIFEVMVIGGGQIYDIFLPHAHRLYLTCLNRHIDGDVYFPRYNSDLWRIIFYEFHDVSQIGCSYFFSVLEYCIQK